MESQGNGLHDSGGQRTKVQKEPCRHGEEDNHEKTGSTAQAPAARLCFCGPSPTKTEPSRFCLMLLAHYGCPIGKKALSDGQQVYMPNMAKIWQKIAKKCTEFAVNHQNGTNFSQGECFSVVLAQAGHYEGLQKSPTLQAAASTKFSPKCPETARKTAYNAANSPKQPSWAKKGKSRVLKIHFRTF